MYQIILNSSEGNEPSHIAEKMNVGIQYVVGSKLATSSPVSNPVIYKVLKTRVLKYILPEIILFEFIHWEILSYYQLKD